MGNLMMLMTSQRQQQGLAPPQQRRSSGGRGAEGENDVMIAELGASRRGARGSRRLARRRVWPRGLEILGVVSLQIVCRQ